ncbi:hypothetical protein CLOM_g17044 [Closterium sp. NIES-68]|nr:hypothetical protein CLOM_g17044 [Closterium sp. NIES-68]GJP61306.1 hypothetical protein CLOP_g18478 [Closterium sp. NIES-67]
MESIQDLEAEALEKSHVLTSATEGLLRITETTKSVAGKTLEVLKDQGEQIQGIHEKALVVDQEMEKSETLIAKLGGIKKLGWRFTHGRRIQGPSSSGESHRGTTARSDHVDRVGHDDLRAGVSETVNRSALGLSRRPGQGQTLTKPFTGPGMQGSTAGSNANVLGSRPKREGLSALDVVKEEQRYQDGILDQVSESLVTLRSMAERMGTEMDSHVEALAKSNTDVDKVVASTKEANRRLGILNRRV